ncbi:polysaccharide deacetylase family protein [Selenomonadales bacterium OttesenSCG-928-I06]|nr:polysaccharide deacetylase family protein [Selenomonadales bacterium OttesenSCG-928-I06]
MAVVFGLSFNTMQNLTTDKSVIKKIPTTHKVVAITIDDGPHAKTTPEILQVLQEKNVKATFFILGVNAEKNMDILKQEAEQGHELANHGYSHKDFSKLTSENILKELNITEQMLESVGVKPILFRPPFGTYNDNSLEIIKQKGYITVLWSVDSSDWSLVSEVTIINNVVKNIKPGDIILFHDGQYPINTMKALPTIIDKLREEGYELLTVSELLKYYEVRK